MSQNAKAKAIEDAQSVITQDRLRQFNDIQGTVAGNATEELAAREAIADFAEADLEPGQGEEGCGQGLENEDGDAEELKDEVLSQM